MTYTRQLPTSKDQQDNEPARKPHQDVESKDSPITNSLHGISDVVAISHGAGAHLSHKTHIVGTIAGGIAETLQNLSNKIEDIVCKTGTRLLKDVIDTSITGTIMAPISAVTTTASPIVSIPVMVSTAATVYKATQKATEPAASALKEICHDTFKQSRENKESLIFPENLPDKNGKTPLHRAIEKDQLENVKKLVDAGASLTKPTKEGYPALNLAVMHSSGEIIDYLLRKGAPIENKSEVNGVTALNHAISNKRPVVTQMLIDSGADINAADKNGWTPLHRSVYHNQPALTKILLLNNAKFNSQTSCKNGYCRATKRKSAG